ncbi:hypothetical protein [Streptomyces sp. NPDC047043]|uniref:hypothetical protein n=1 Tax=Streptomyces sp. NPDC047043 TaxID=3154497 RepID=UPI00340BDCE4
MVRYVHHELMAAVALVIATAVGVAVAFAVDDSASLVAGGAAWLAGSGLVFVVLSAALRSSRLKWVGSVREFEAAVPATDGDPALRSRTLGMALRFSLFLVPGVALGLLGFSTALMIALAMAVDWSVKAAVGARWERRNGRRLWLGHNDDEPGRLFYFPVTPPPSTRTATDAPPA